MNTKRMLRAVFVMLYATCTFTATETWAQAGRKVPIRMGTDVSTMGLAFWVADSEGIFDKHGIRPMLKIHEIGFQALLAVGAGEADTSIQSESPTIVNIAKGIDAVIIATIARGPQTYKAVARREISGPKDLVGKRIGVTMGSGGEFFLVRYLKKHSINTKAVTIQNAGPPELTAMLYKGEVDAVFTWEPFGRKILSLERASERLAQFATGKDYYDPSYLLTVGRKFTEDNPEAIKSLLTALAESNTFISKNPEKAVQIAQRTLRTTRAEATASLNDYVTVAPILDKDTIEALTDISLWLKDGDRIKSIPDWNKIVEPKFLRQIDPTKVRM